jgi:hypothetical protein
MGGLVEIIENNSLRVGGFLDSSLYTSYEAKYFKMNKKEQLREFSEIYFWVFKIYSVTMKQFLENALPYCVYSVQ